VALTDLEKFHRWNKVPGFRFESTLAANNLAYGAGILVSPEGDSETCVFHNGRLISGDIIRYLEKYGAEFEKALQG
jgi:hypothetical protein